VRNAIRTVLLGLILFPAVGGASPQNQADAQQPLPWAYGFPEDGSSPAPPAVCAVPPGPDVIEHVAGSAESFTHRTIQACFDSADWFPQSHPPMPEIVSHGRKPGVHACALCHYPNGQGRPENASVVGLPVEYFIQQMNDFKHDLRNSAEPRKANAIRMINYAKGMTDDEIKLVAEYFGSMKFQPWIKVVESADMPRTHLVNSMYIPNEGAVAGTEPLGQRIREVPVNAVATGNRDPRSGFIAYVPIGSLKKGEDIVTSGVAVGGKTTPCGVCHGPKMLGIGPIPPLAGRSASYMARELVDMQRGTRNGASAPLMKGVVANLTSDDIINITAYLASLPPQ
jgi:cytochrome c553